MSARVWCNFRNVKQRVTIKEAMQALGIDMGDYAESDNGSGVAITGPCPLPDHKVFDAARRNERQFRIDSPGRDCDYDLFHCFSNDHPSDGQATGTGAGGDVIQFVAQMLQTDLAHTRHFFADYFSDRISTQKPRGPTRSGTKKAREASWADETSQATVTTSATVEDSKAPVKPMTRFLELDPEHPYLRERGVEPDTARAFGIGYCQRGVLAGHIAMPFCGHPHPAGTPPLCYLGRWAGEDFADKGKPKYRWGQKGFPKSRFVYNLGGALSVDSDCLICCEGAFDVFHLTQAGLAQSVAIIGSSMSDEQAALLAASRRKIILMFDGVGDSDSSGLDGMRQAAAKLLHHTGCFVAAVFLPDNTDPASLPGHELAALLDFVS